MAFQKVLKPKAEDFRKLSVKTDTQGPMLRSYALYVPKCAKPKKHIIYLPKDILIEKSDDVKTLWITASNYENGKPVKPNKGYHLRHHYTAFIEDKMHDWDIRHDDKGKPYISYYGSGTRGDVWLILILTEDK